MNGEMLEDVRKKFSKDQFAKECGVYIEDVGDHFAKCSLKLTEEHQNSTGDIMGGVYFTLADFTFAVAANWNEPLVVSLNASITYLAVPKGSKMFAEAHCIKEGRHTNCYRVDLYDDLENMVAFVTITGFRKSGRGCFHGESEDMFKEK